jgi:outer membrane protein OmpA-like peptidoglycan-associated protein
MIPVRLFRLGVALALVFAAQARADDPPAAAGTPGIMTDTDIERALQPRHSRGLQLRGLKRRDAAADDAAVNLNVPFEYNSSELKPEAFTQLTQLKSALTSDALIHDRFLVAGHTDSKGNARYNQQLSVRRADSVKRFLVTNGIAPGRLDIVGYGGDRPFDAGRPEDPKNRRVEIRLIGEGASEH